MFFGSMGRFTWINTVIFALHWISIISKVTTAAGIFELRLNSFSNDQAKDIHGQCCTGNNTSTDLCVGPCRTYFTVCLLHFLREIPDEPLPEQCTFDFRNTSVLGENSFEVTDGLIQIAFDIDWPGDFSLALDAWHDESSNDGARRRLESLRVHRSLNASSVWSNFTYPTALHTLDYSYRVVCAENFYGSKCQESCTPQDDIFGHFVCNNQGQRVCMEGWDGVWCDKAVCSEECVHGSCDEPNTCKCDNGYKGAACDQCQTYEGCEHGTCNEPGDCICDEGWGGLLCTTDLNYCTNHQPCLNGATCQNEGILDYRCYCTPLFTGQTCETAIACPCLNGGTCSSGPDGYTCLCPVGLTGDLCEKQVPRCESNMCMNGSTCMETFDGYRCACQEGYTGTHCEIRDHCSSSPCRNGATCINNNVAYQCTCPDGFRGDQCEENLCATRGCLNGGTCRAESDSVHCECPLGFNGDHCQNNINDCASSPCKNGGTCYDLLNDYRCECAFGFGGPNCRDHFTVCDGDNPCANGGTCLRDVMGGFMCECAEGWRGTTCTQSTGPVQTSVPTDWQRGSQRPNIRATSSPTIKFGLSDTTQLVIYVAFGLLVIVLVIILIIVVYRKQHHPDPRQNDLESNTTSTPNNRNRHTYKDNFSQEEKVLPLLSISEKVCNKEQDTYSKANSQNTSSALQHKTNHYSIEEYERPPPSKNKMMIIQTSSNKHNVPQARHSYPRKDSDEYYYYDEKHVQLQRTDSLQTPSQSSSSQSTPRHTGSCTISQISAVVEDSRGTTTPTSVGLFATEV
ncbi:delta-like protein 1 [Lytechinus variegatus]|uniref:Delta-like protein n=1 Tax=Lytechinus variegatus TaxID=7654 RepID=Q8T4P0_LYTVA|nr:delta-like protein 1 [Lytechinus variegatus]AAL71861.1 delta protein [Lytechinus variegatus]ALG35694.1 Delta [Lytechinus variegatus]